jgi:pimeloyl-ACP methyl ester carboxylesterase
MVQGLNNKSQHMQSSSPTTLIVLAPDHRGNPEALLNLKEWLDTTFDSAETDYLEFEYIRPLYSNRSLASITQDLGSQIQVKYLNLKSSLNKIILVGHSMGASLVRRCYLDAMGYGLLQKQEWSSKVERIVLLGGFGRGLRVKDMPFPLNLLEPIKDYLYLSPLGRMRLEMLRGSDFISALRIDWVRFYAGPSSKKPLAIHLKGSDDQFIRDEDVVELKSFDQTTMYIVGGSDHFTISSPEDSTKSLYREAFLGDLPREHDSSVDTEKSVFLLLHGIRDDRKCFNRLEEKLRFLSQEPVVDPLYYGYFTARAFLNTPLRNSQISELADRYSDYLAKYPKAVFFCAAHSNGTYIAGEALRRIPSIKLKRLYLAASVLPPDFDWKTIIETRNQVTFIRCDMGTEDIPVGVICRGLNQSGLVRSVGAGGSRGFTYGSNEHISYNYYKGGHGAMLEEYNTDSMASFLSEGEHRKDGMTSSEVKRAQIFEILETSSFLLIYAFLLLLGALAFAPLLQPWGKPVALVLIVLTWVILEIL